MMPLRKFEEFVKQGVVVRRSPNQTRANSLRDDSSGEKKFFDEVRSKIALTDENANSFIKSCYDIIMPLLRAKMLEAGFDASGDGAHEAEVSYMRNLGFSGSETGFINDLRYFRKGILYYGEKHDAEYALKVIDFMERCYAKLRA